MMPTFADLAGVKASVATDGVSLVPSLMGQPAQQKSREYLYWEFEGRQAVRMQQWKAVRLKTAAATELFDLSTDPSEKVNVAAAHPEIAKRAEDIFLNGRTESALFPLK